MSDRPPAPVRAARTATALFSLSACALLAAAVVYAAGGHVQWQGALLGVGLVSFGAACVVWANRLLGGGPYEEPREPLVAPPEESDALVADLDRGEALSRRRWLRRSALAAGGALVVTLVEPLRWLGPAPGKRPLRTAWGPGVRVVTEDGEIVRADAVPLGGLLTVFPEGHREAADAQVVLVRVDPALLRLPEGREAWAPDGLVAYSKVCTHAACPVGLYQTDTHQLLCPCHQSSFDVLRAAAPVSGPAAWPLPQLPLSVGEDGILSATGDLSEPPGPGWWST